MSFFGIGSRKSSIKRKKAAPAFVVDGSKIQALLDDKEDLDQFLAEYFRHLDKDGSGKLTWEEMKPALLKFSVMAGLPAKAQGADDIVDTLFTAIMADRRTAEVDKDLFIAVSDELLRKIYNHLAAKPLVVRVYEGKVLRELASNPEACDELVDDFYNEFDRDGTGNLKRLELKHALITLGIVPPDGVSKERDLLLSRLMIKYAGDDMLVNRQEFRKMLRDIVAELADSLADESLMVSEQDTPMLTAAALRKVLEDEEELKDLSRQLFKEWDLLQVDQLTKKQLLVGFKKLLAESELPLLTKEEAEAVCESAFARTDSDRSGYVEQFQFGQLLKDLLLAVSAKLDAEPLVAGDGAGVAAEEEQGEESTPSVFGSWMSSSLSKLSVGDVQQRSVEEIKAAHAAKKEADAEAAKDDGKQGAAKDTLKDIAKSWGFSFGQ